MQRHTLYRTLVPAILALCALLGGGCTNIAPGERYTSLERGNIDALKAANTRLLDGYAAKDPLFKEVLDSQRAYLAKARAWSIVSDYAYMKDNQ